MMIKKQMSKETKMFFNALRLWGKLNPVSQDLMFCWMYAKGGFEEDAKKSLELIEEMKKHIY